MDISMPIMNGFEATKGIREFESMNKLYKSVKQNGLVMKSKIIGVTAHSNDIYNDCIACGMDDLSTY